MIAAEFAKQIRRWRTLILVLLSGILSLLVAILVGHSAQNGNQGAGAELPILLRSSGVTLGIVALLGASHLLVPIAFTVYFGEPMASESKWGTLRYLLLRPVSRSRVLTAKIVVALVLALASLLLIPLLATVVGSAYFGLHPMVVTPGLAGLGLAHQISVTGSLGRLAMATGYVGINCAGVAGVAVLVSVATENVLAAVASGFGFLIVSALIDALPGSFIKHIQPALPTNYLDAWTSLFQPGQSLQPMQRGVIMQVAWLAVTLAAAYFLFRRKDIKC
ncbi:MAG: ABC transporter permease [Acidimicrobiales bacterium]|jgi:ABC-2 type transport system permease protein